MVAKEVFLRVKSHPCTLSVQSSQSVLRSIFETRTNLTPPILLIECMHLQGAWSVVMDTPYPGHASWHSLSWLVVWKGIWNTFYLSCNTCGIKGYPLRNCLLQRFFLTLPSSNAKYYIILPLSSNFMFFFLPRIDWLLQLRYQTYNWKVLSAGFLCCSTAQLWQLWKLCYTRVEVPDIKMQALPSCLAFQCQRSAGYKNASASFMPCFFLCLAFSFAFNTTDSHWRDLQAFRQQPFIAGAIWINWQLEWSSFTGSL